MKIELIHNIDIAPWTKDDGARIFDLILPIQREEFGVDITAAQQPDLNDIPGYYQTGHGNLWLAKEGSEIVGSIALKDIGDNEVALRKMFVRKDYRGGDKGIAAALLQTALEWSNDKSVRSIYLGTTPMFLAAHRFYEKNGFEKIDQSALPPSFPVMAVDKIFYLYRFS